MNKTPTDKTDTSFIPIDRTDTVKAARAALTPIRAKHQELQARINRYGGIEERPLRELADRPTDELNAQINLGSWREELARTTVALREAQTKLDEAIAAERQKLRAEIARQKQQAVRGLRERLLAAREANEPLRQLEIAEQDLLGEPVTVLNWSAFAFSDSSFTSRLDEWLCQMKAESLD
jgi:hypothetical protein